MFSDANVETQLLYPKNGLKYYAGTKPTEAQLQIKRHIGLRGLCLVFGYSLVSLVVSRLCCKENLIVVQYNGSYKPCISAEAGDNFVQESQFLLK